MIASASRQHAVRSLRDGGILNPERAVKLMRSAISRLSLDLRGCTVLTEAASGPYVCTPVIAAMAGADRVIAITRDSPYATAEQVIQLTRSFELLTGSPKKIEIFVDRRSGLFAQADIVTNLGFVRPINREAISELKPGAVVSLMCEAWELRPEDIDIEVCRDRGVWVGGTNEDFQGVEVFDYTGQLCLRMLFDAQIEVRKTNVIVVSGDKFGKTVVKSLREAGSEVELFARVPSAERLRSADALIVADYCRTDEIIGQAGDVTPTEVARWAPHLTVVQFCGAIDAPGLREEGIAVFPSHSVGPRRMAVTLAGLGPRPVIDLHAAGLKVGEILLGYARGRCKDSYESLVQHVVGPDTTTAGHQTDKRKYFRTYTVKS